MKNKVLVYGLILIIFGLSSVSVYYYKLSNKGSHVTLVPTENIKSLQESSPTTTPLSPATVSTTTVQNPFSYAYLFTEEEHPSISNIVGYFGGGAFVWYVPDWLVNNWELHNMPWGMQFTPKTRLNADDFSDITFTVGTSTESSNAATLYDREITSIGTSMQIQNEVVLNKHTEGGLKLMIETDTRIYHVQESNPEITKDLYFIDGNGQTVTISFEAKTNIFAQFSTQIRNLVEGIGEMKAPQG